VLPEVGDEVLVGFAHGDFDDPYVLGALHNGKDAPPTFSVAPVDSGTGEIAVRGFVSRKAHKLEFVEAEGIAIASGDGKFVIRLDQKNQRIEVTSGKAIAITARNGVTVDAGTGPLQLKGQKVTVESASDVAVEANASMKLTATGTVTMSGSMVRIN
jgi:uncharacterized protein involved in type VI secretion and phage assembly